MGTRCSALGSLAWACEVRKTRLGADDSSDEDEEEEDAWAFDMGDYGLCMGRALGVTGPLAGANTPLYISAQH